MIRLFRKLRNRLRRRKLYKASVKFNESRLGRKLMKHEKYYLKCLTEVALGRRVISRRGPGKSFDKAIRYMKQMGVSIKYITIDEWIDEKPPLRKEI